MMSYGVANLELVFLSVFSEVFFFVVHFLQKITFVRKPIKGYFAFNPVDFNSLLADRKSYTFISAQCHHSHETDGAECEQGYSIRPKTEVWPCSKMVANSGAPQGYVLSLHPAVLSTVITHTDYTQSHDTTTSFPYFLDIKCSFPGKVTSREERILVKMF